MDLSQWILKRSPLLLALGALGGTLLLSGCRSAAEHRERADRSASAIIAEKQQEAFGESVPFTIEQPSRTFRERLMLEQNLVTVQPASLGSAHLEDPEHWPEDIGEPLERPDVFLPDSFARDGSVELDLVDALRIAAANSRQYQSEKESVFRAALQLDLERYRFDTSFIGLLNGILSSDQGSNQTGAVGSAEVGLERQLESGATLGGRLIVDLVRLLSGEGASSLGLAADASITIPLLRGAGKHIVTESRTQAERDVLYALYRFERFKHDYAVQIASEYFSVLQQIDQIANAEASYQRLTLLVNRTKALNTHGRVTGIEVSQAEQDLLRARERWISAREGYARALDRFKLTLGLPTDANIHLSGEEFTHLLAEAETMLGTQTTEIEIDLDEATPIEEQTPEMPTPDPDERGRYEFDEDRAVALALENRLDLRIAAGEVYDAQRRVIVAEDALGAGLNLTGNASFGARRASVGAATSPNARLDPSDGFYSLGATLDLPWSRRDEGVAFRQSLIALESTVRALQALEDQVKLDVRDALSNMLQQREGYRIQSQALTIAEFRVRQTQALQEADRAETRDVLEANDALVQAQNAVVDALVSYRISELSLQRDLGVLDVNHQGLWNEYDPQTPEDYERE